MGDLDVLESALRHQLKTAPEHSSFVWGVFSKIGASLTLTYTLKINADGLIASDLLMTYQDHYGTLLKSGFQPQLAVDGLIGSVHANGFLISYPLNEGFPPIRAEHCIHLPLHGAQRGRLQYPVLMAPSGFAREQASGPSNFIGFKYYTRVDQVTQAQAYPLMDLGGDTGESSIKLLFNTSWDPLNSANTRFTFAGGPFRVSTTGGPDARASITPMVGQGAGFTTFFRTIYGERISLQPVLEGLNPGTFVLENSPSGPPYLTPSGDYALALSSGSTGTHYLLGGLSGTEYIGFRPGDILTFHPHQPAFAPTFPVVTGEGYGGSSSALITDTQKTAWLSIGPASAGAPHSDVPKYYSQPQKAPLFRSGATGPSRLLDIFPTPSAYFTAVGGAVGGTGATGPGPRAFPLVPYAGVDQNNLSPFFGPTGSMGPSGATAPSHTLRDFELQILNPTRKQAIAASPGPTGSTGPQHALSGIRDLSLGGSVVPSVTPQGFFVEVDTSNATWAQMILCQNQGRHLQFLNVSSALQSALQTNEQFLVITKNDTLGTLSPTGATGPNATFDNLISIEGWPFQFNVGSDNTPGNYSNILIFKFCKGSVLERVRNVASWTSPGVFNADGVGDLASLSNWLIQYIKDGVAQAETDTDFENFKHIVTDPEWNGVLGLKLGISLQDFPQQLQGLLAGMDLSLFNAHHLGVNVNHPQHSNGRLSLSDKSSLFALINYVDPNPNAVGIGPQASFGFNVLTLKVLFKNSRITSFASTIQLTIQKLFGDEVTKITSGGYPAPGKSIVLTGNFEDHNGHPTYTFTESGDTKFYLAGNVLQVVELLKANFSTLKPHQSGATGATAAQVNSVFSLWGYLNFGPLGAGVTGPSGSTGATGATGSTAAQGFDLFSFGSQPGQLAADSEVGLCFSNLNIDLNFPLLNPSEKTFALDVRHTAFDLGQSSMRPDSLYRHFPLQVSGLIQGSQQDSAFAQGFLPIAVPSMSAQTLDSEWYGLVFDIDFGSPGALAAKGGFTGKLVAQWSPGTTFLGGSGQSFYKAAAVLSLPGVTLQSKFLDLEGVLKVDINQIEFLVTPETHAYLLKLNQIALKFLGVKIPPSAQIDFFLFGNPEPGAKPGSLGWYGAYQK
ncbi:hypothetical protein [Microbulbifer sp. DLAB2-AA]|uniref:hypothetical protein n=1 Tax=Microbulbifer sp. DLAB2-AA TaxID=3243394 RepID=UPI0040397A20